MGIVFGSGDIMKDLWQTLKTQEKPIYLYGMGNGADKILDECIKRRVKICGVFASDGFVRNQQFRGFTVESYSDVKKREGDFTALLCFGSSLENVISSIKEKMGEITLLSPSVPVCGTNIFDGEFYEKNLEKIEFARSLLADGMSKKVYDGIISYRLSGELKYLFEIETDRFENYSLLSLQDEVFADLGAYRGETIREIDKICNIIKAYAFEPDSRSFGKLSESFSKNDRTECFNFAVGEKDGEEAFSQNRGRGSSLGEGNGKIKTVCLDNLLSDKKITFIKADVEGNEINALRGAKGIIEKNRPKLKISVYHRAEDIFEIPIFINRLNGRYKIYLRHERSVPDWETDVFAVEGE